MKKFFRTKNLANTSTSEFIPTLNALDLTLLGIGAIIGAGVFVLTGVAAATKAGPGISVSYIIAGLAALFSALSYAELATSIGGSGSAYTYAYVGCGEIIAWIIGWALLLEYIMSVATVAVGWSGYVVNVLTALQVPFPTSLSKDIFSGGLINLPAVLIIIFLAFLLCRGTKQSARFNAIIVVIKLITIAAFIGIALGHVNLQNWNNFFPFGFNGVAQGAAIVFFAYIGFDALSTAAEETIHPQRNLPIGIITSLFICTLIYVVVALLLTGIVPYPDLNVASPVAYALLLLGYRFSAGLIAFGAIAGLTTVMLVMYFGLTRILFSISRDGLIPAVFSKVDPKTRTPNYSIKLTGLVIVLIAGFVPLTDIAELVNIGTLIAFTFVCLGVMLIRYRYPDLERPFKQPYHPLFPLLGVIFCIFLMVHLSTATWIRFLIWMLIGLVIYFSYSIQRSKLEKS